MAHALSSLANDIWWVLKYHDPVIIPNTLLKPCYFLFILQAHNNACKLILSHANEWLYNIWLNMWSLKHHPNNFLLILHCTWLSLNLEFQQSKTVNLPLIFARGSSIFSSASFLLLKLVVNGDLTAMKVVACCHSSLFVHHQRVCYSRGNANIF